MLLAQMEKIKHFLNNDLSINKDILNSYEESDSEKDDRYHFVLGRKSQIESTLRFLEFLETGRV